MGAFACGTLKDICLPRLVLPAYLPPEALGEMEARCKPCLDWHIIVANNPRRQLGPACPTRRHLGPFTIMPCSQTGKQCPGHTVLKLLPHPQIAVV